MNENIPLYMKIYNTLISEIKSGRYQDGDRLPTELEISEQFSVSRITSRKALDILAEEGYINRTPGKGSFVTLSSGDDEGEEEASKTPEEKRRIIGFVVPDFSSSYGIDLLSGIEKEAHDNDYIFTFYRTYGRQDIEEKAIDFLTDIGADGIIIMPVHGEHYNPKILKMVLDKFPFVLVDRFMHGIQAPFVGTDNVAAAKKLTDYVLELGHKNVSFISPPVIDTSTLEDRREGFVKSHAEKGIAVDESLWLTDFISTIPGKSSEENIRVGIDVLKELILSKPEITCFFVVEYNLALMVLEAIQEIGKRVPEDYSIVCFDGPVNYAGKYLFTHIRQKEVQMGNTAVNMLIKQIDKTDGSEKVQLDTCLIMGDSTRQI